MEMNFCRRCGAPLTHIENNNVYRCENAHMLFASPAPTVGIFFVADDLSTVFAVRGRDPGKGMLDIPGGFIDPFESVEQALVREIAEELNLQPNDYGTPIYFSSAADTYFYQEENRTIITLSYISKLKPGVILTPQDDVADIKIISLKDIDIADIANGDIRALTKALQAKLL